MTERKELSRYVSRLKAGEMPRALENRPFIIMRERVNLVLTHNGVFQWTLTLSPDEKEKIEIDRKTAIAIIDNFSMEMARNCFDGQIYEMPGNPFRAAYSTRN